MKIEKGEGFMKNKKLGAQLAFMIAFLLMLYVPVFSNASDCQKPSYCRVCLRQGHRKEQHTRKTMDLAVKDEEQNSKSKAPVKNKFFETLRQDATVGSRHAEEAVVLKVVDTILTVTGEIERKADPVIHKKGKRGQNIEMNLEHKLAHLIVSYRHTKEKE